MRKADYSQDLSVTAPHTLAARGREPGLHQGDNIVDRHAHGPGASLRACRAGSKRGREGRGDGVTLDGERASGTHSPPAHTTRKSPTGTKPWGAIMTAMEYVTSKIAARQNATMIIM